MLRNNQVNKVKMENSNEISILDILELSHSLRQEKLCIESEMNDYFRLQVKLNDNSFEAIKIAWILAIHRQNLNSLILSKPENRPSLCCQRATQLENVEFIDAYRDPTVKSHHLPLYVDFLRYVHQNPQLLAHCLAVADDLPSLGTTSTASKADQMSEITQIISASLYGNSIHGRDVEMMLKLLDKLLEVKISTIEDPRRLLRQSSSSFARLYHKFHESSLSSKLFLTAALHEPVMSVLINDTIMLNIDQVTGINDLLPKVKSNRSEMIDTLFTLSCKFIDSLSANWIIFPSTIRWLVQTMSKYLHAKGCDANTILEILTDMVFGHFILPACTNPNLYNITDAPISDNARFNLIQIGQILQMMALSKHQNVEKKFIELYNKFDQNVISDLMEKLLENTYDISEMGLSHQLPTLYNIGRSSILITQAELTLFLQFLRASLDSEQIDSSEKKKLKNMLENLPVLIENHIQPIKNGIIETSPNKKSSKLIQQLSKSSKSKIVKNPSASSLNAEDNASESTSEETLDRVLIIPLSIYENSNKMRPLSEDEVLNMNQVPSERTESNSLTEKNIEELSRRNDDDLNSNETRDKETQTKFLMNQDDVSIGNTSDNLELEAVSEAPSNHSVASSLDLEENNDNLGDNLSDMVSANVSGRGTPNISGRDTPSSQVIDGGEAPKIPMPQMAKIINKARNDIEDKFCKFEIKKLIEGDETISIISDTWSTDVLASDSETIGESERNFSTPLIPSSIIIPDTFQLRTNNFDISETQSESAWSTDVLIASDSEKNGEIDNDDTQSITTRSDITESTTPRDQEVPNTNESPFFAATPRVPNINFRPIDPSGITPRTPDSPFSFRSTEDSPRPVEPIARDHFRARPIARSGGALFSSNFNYLATPSTSSATNSPNRPFRQHSNESQSSIQSEQEPKPKSPLREKKPVKEFIDSQQQSLSVFHVSDPNLENFSNDTNSSNNKVIKTSINLINPFLTSGNDDSQDQTKANNNNDKSEQVEHRRLSAEQRSVSYDSRRNGMVDLMTSPIILSTSDNPFDAPEVKSQHSHVIKANSIDIDGDLCAKTENLKLNDTVPSSSTGAIPKIPNGNVKNHKATGTIPKSISFDSTADKAERNHHRRSEGSSNRHMQQPTGIFNKIRQGFKKRGKGNTRNSIDEALNASDILLNGSPNRNVSGNGFIENVSTESSDDILAKYRNSKGRKPSSSSDSAGSSNNSSSLKSKSSENENRLSHLSNNREADCFNNAKRKLRLVLSTSDCHACDVRNNNASSESPLFSYLQVQLAQAMNQQNLQQVSYVHELLRCLNSLSPEAHYKLIEELQKDLTKRQSYLQYLIRLRQDLLSTIATIDNFQKRLQNDRDMINRHLVMVCVKMFMERRESFVKDFQEDFTSKPAADEKLELMEEFIGRLMQDLMSDGISQGMNEMQLIEARNCIEKILLQRLYHQVMFPNDDVDISNDELLHNCIKKLGRIITPSHVGLKIPHRYLNEAPWPYAQQQISYISAYKTPQEKVQCVIRCIQSIMYLLKMASNQQPAADDLVPVLIYVIIKANPPYLQSTINYVECFMGKRLEGEELYWWTQFSTAILFIKTLIERMEKTGHENCE
ncbi:hypothetical protein PVAND_012776 [Polypedilum vanderplanki]|uniref:Receptor-mediated endocytosis protein 6 homolog n=1 Tax=Polypedilum vanderplanki TaxID=319348 RepID=A0A9J6CNF8_POLVA|nr:hypothetical protein PVAND_012776 [Polypedilum vanderplanki]